MCVNFLESGPYLKNPLANFDQFWHNASLAQGLSCDPPKKGVALNQGQIIGKMLTKVGVAKKSSSPEPPGGLLQNLHIRLRIHCRL